MKRLIRLGAALGAAAVVFATAAPAQALPALSKRQLVPGFAAPYDQFGCAVAASGTTALVGSCQAHHEEGSAHVFVRSGTAWTEQAELIPRTGVSGDLLGAWVSLSGSTALVGAEDAAATFAFVRSGSTWSEQRMMTAASRLLRTASSQVSRKSTLARKSPGKSAAAWAALASLSAALSFEMPARDRSRAASAAARGSSSLRSSKTSITSSGSRTGMR